jgi:inositol transport system permease protein
VYAIGGNVEAAEISGIKVSHVIVWVYIISGVLAGLSALIFMGRTGGSIQPAAGTMFETTAIAAATIGGTSHSGGVGKVWGAVVGALILGTMTNGFTLLGIDAYIQQIIQGVIIVGAVIIDMRKNKKAA